MIVGHQKQWQFLKKSAELKKIPHGILFCGPEKVGKKTLAIEFAKLLNCSLSEFAKKPCQICRDCQDIQKIVHPDLILIEPSVGKEGIQISQIRDLILKLSLRSYSSLYKIAIIDRVHLMTQEAQSCFLKLLEEPKGNAVLILITEYPEMLLPTIISRIQKLKFSPVEKSEIENYIVSRGVSPEKASKLASIAFGRPGLAIDFLSTSETLENRKKFISDLEKIFQSDLSLRFQYAKSLTEKKSDSPINISDILNIWLDYFRKAFLSRLRFSNIKTEKRDENLSQYSLSKIMKIISLIQSTDFLISTTNASPKLAIELLLMEI